ncbi:type 1 glutamine amidotransferase [Nocardioides marinquilinus]|uniref:type 1 glutamine amidotransferase n=1 Tax=Nocardioides marinquilinus TaxID=1210400 RepID=UPI0031ECD089
MTADDVTGPRLLVVEHQATCPPGPLGAWLAEAGCTLDVVRPYDGDPLPGLDGHDGLLVMGGSMDAFDDDVPWLAPTRALVVDAAERGVPVLGVCLGHQLAALALGGTVGRNPRGQQVGLRDVGRTEAAATDPLLAEVTGPAVFWNQDVVLEPPPGAVELARAATGELQAARWADRVWGLQWHPEADAAILDDWARKDAERHLERGLDQAEVLAAVDAARDGLDRDGHRLAAAFAREAGA